MAAFSRYNVRASGANGEALYFQNITIFDNDSLDAYSKRLDGAGVRLLSAELIGSSSSEAVAPIFQDVIRTLPVGVPAGPPLEDEANPAQLAKAAKAAQGGLLFYGAIAIGLYLLFR